MDRRKMEKRNVIVTGRLKKNEKIETEVTRSFTK
jgi:hypothetical protein